MENIKRDFTAQEKVWVNEQEKLKSKLICNDTEEWMSDIDDDKLRYVAGLDVSYDKDESERGCAALVIYDLTNQSVVYDDKIFVNVTTEYSAGFLAFREVDFILELVDRFFNSKIGNQYEPQVWLFDGNGLMHPRRFGLASHIGVLIDRPTVGVSKSPYHFIPTDRKQFKHNLNLSLVHRGDRFNMTDEKGNILGVALKTKDSVKNPIYVSIGHRVSLETAIKVVLRCCIQFKNPEPIRFADQISREALRNKK
ncbi:hypothetical protein BLOT_010863 [Blomia tropicalis]|nr:hypothetical protein BLOT_010863 [Blomia tropicalis]